MSAAAVEIAREFWRLMNTNDFHAVGAVLADDFILDWPQTNERIRGRERFATVNVEFPASGVWVFTVIALSVVKSRPFRTSPSPTVRAATEQSRSSPFMREKSLVWSSIGPSPLPRLPIAAIS